MTHDSHSREDEARLIASAGAGDARALEDLYRQHEKRAYNLALRMMGDPWNAADATQEAFVKAFSALHRFRGDSRFSTWLHRIVVNTVHDHLRTRRDEPCGEEQLDHLLGRTNPVETAPGSGQGNQPTGDGLSDQMKAALLALDEGFRVVVILCDLLGFPYQEAAEILEIQEGTVKSRIYRARSRLAQILATDEEGDGRGDERNSPATETVQDMERHS